VRADGVIARSAASSMPAIGALQSARDESFQEGAPVDFGLRDLDRDAEHDGAAQSSATGGGRVGEDVATLTPCNFYLQAKRGGGRVSVWRLSANASLEPPLGAA
jgi:hypothetical protein